MKYIRADQISRSLNERNDCTVKAIAITCNVPYKVAHQALKRQGRRDRCGSYHHEQAAAIKSLGFKWEAIAVDAKTVSQIARDDAVQDGYFLAYVRGHVAAVVNGKVEDWTEGRRHRIKQVYRITPDATRKERKQMQKAIFR